VLWGNRLDRVDHRVGVILKRNLANPMAENTDMLARCIGSISNDLLQLGVFRFGFLQNRNVWVGLLSNEFAFAKMLLEMGIVRWLR
jgi:hypothetical protein